MPAVQAWRLLSVRIRRTYAQPLIGAVRGGNRLYCDRFPEARWAGGRTMKQPQPPKEGLWRKLWVRAANRQWWGPQLNSMGYHIAGC